MRKARRVEAVTLAKHFGATATAVAAPAKHDTVRALGADHVIDSRTADTAARLTLPRT
jgi:NADPH2:quinone reductase